MPTLNEANTMVVHEANHRGVNVWTHLEASAMYNSHGNIMPQQNSFSQPSYTSQHNNGQNNRSFLRNYSDNDNSKGRKSFFCIYFHLEGHTKEKCWKLNGYHVGHKFQNA